MKITPKTEEEIAQDGLFKPDVYPFEVIEAFDKLSKKGNEMIHLKLRVFNGEETTFIDDYLLESMARKLRHAVVQLIGEQNYDMGCFEASSFVGKEGWAKVGIQKSKDPQFYDKNQIVDYVSAPVAETAGVSANKDTDVPWE